MLEFLNRWLPLDASAHGPALDRWTAVVHWLMLVLFVGWGLYLLYVLFRFRAGRHPRASYQGATSHASTYIEGGVAVVEGVLLVAFAIPAWDRWVTPPSPADEPVLVRVVGEQFAWNVHYPGPDGRFGRSDPRLMSATNPLGLDPANADGRDDVTAINQLRLPVDRPVTIELSTKDVIHSFGLPYFRVKQDAIPGQDIPVHFTPVMVTPPGGRLPQCAAAKTCWEIACAQLCGLGHFRMRGYVAVLEQAEFEAWMAEQVAAKLAAAPAPVPATSVPAPAAPAVEAPEGHDERSG